MKFKYKKFIYVGTFSIMFLGMMLFSTGPLLNSKPKEGLEVAKETLKSEQAQEEKVGQTASSSGELKRDAYPEVNQLVQDYFEAKLQVDKEKIETCVDNLEFVGMTSLPKKVKEIEKIEDLVCYTLDGPEEDSYIVYAYHEVKFKNISTKSTSLDGYYIKKDGSGKLKIILSPLSEEVQKIINENSKREDVAALISDVNTKLKNEIKSDKQLAELLNNMKESEKK